MLLPFYRSLFYYLYSSFIASTLYSINLHYFSFLLLCLFFPPSFIVYSIVSFFLCLLVLCNLISFQLVMFIYLFLPL
jgi:hypothetical protein